MPCNDSSASISLKIDKEEKLISFDFAKISCGRRINGDTGFHNLCHDQNLKEVLSMRFEDIIKKLQINDEENLFILYLEWDCLRSAIAQ